MESLYGLAVSLAVPVFFVLIAIELAADRIRHRDCYHLADAISNLSCGMVSTGTRVFFGFLGVLAYTWTLEHCAPVRLGPSWPVWLFALVLYDFCYYWQHRLGHTVGLFWAAHSVHHQSEEFNLTTALRQPGMGAFTNWIFYVPMALGGIPLQVFGVVAVAQLFYQFWPHTQLIGRMGALDRWIQTPSNHRVHHAQNDIYLDRNYVGIFTIWDRLFGTFQEELNEEPCIYGVRGQLKSWNPVWANLHYYWIMLQDSWHAASWRDKVRVWYAPPGWRPADVAARFPKPAYDPHRDFVRFDPPRSAALSLYAMAQFVLLLAAHSHFLAVLARQSRAANLLYFLFLLVSLVVLGGILENRRVFLVAEAVRLIGTAAAVLIWGEWFGNLRDAGVRGAILAVAMVSLGWLAAAWRGTGRWGKDGGAGMTPPVKRMEEAGGC